MNEEDIFKIISSSSEDITKNAYDIIEKMKGNKTEIRGIIDYLNSDELNKRISSESKTKKESDHKHNNKQILLEKLKQSISRSYLDYDIDYFIELFFPKSQLPESSVEPELPAVPSSIETKEVVNTYMFAHPVDNTTLHGKTKESSQENNPFGFDITVSRKDPKNVALSEMLGVEQMLFILNQSGSNAKYWEEYYYGEDKTPNPVYTNVYSTKKKII